jgi:hypothetical protein
LHWCIDGSTQGVLFAFGLAKQIDVSRTEAKQYIEAYFENYPNVLNYMDSTKELAKEKGFVETAIHASTSSMAFLMISAEEPCIGALMAVRRACCCSILKT